MDSYRYAVYISLSVIAIGALLQTTHLLPRLLDKTFDTAATKLTVAGVLLGLSFLLVMGVLRTINRANREGFEVPKAMDLWRQMTETYQIAEVCALKGRLEEALIPAEKGSPPTLTDQQARERVEKLLSDGSSQGIVNCELLQKVNEAKDIDTFFTVIREVPEVFLIQVQDTAERMNTLLEKQYTDVMKSLGQTEGFVDPSVGICSPEVTEERRKFLREKKLDEEAQKCLLPEEVPLETKDTMAADKVRKIQEAYDAYIRMSPNKPLLSDVLKKSLEYETKLNEKKKAAESGTLLQELSG